MDRPDIELFEDRLRGAFGLNWKVQMEFVGMHQLLEYVKHLEETSKSNG